MLTHLPPSAGVGLKPDHFRETWETGGSHDGLWLEVHAENYMIAGGPRLAWLELIASRFPVSFHGVGLSLGGPEPLDADHLARWTALIERIEPAAVSEHIAWSVADGEYFADLLPTPATRAALERLCENIDRMQTALGRPILIENPAHYIPLKAEMSEPDFLAEACARTGCGLLLDLNNIAVSANNIGRSTGAYLAAIDFDRVGEIHIAGARPDPNLGQKLLIDSHDAPVDEPVWEMLARVIADHGPRPVLIERDSELPPFEDLMAERDRAQSLIAANRAALARHD
ncbi:DUF692 domain-containing protein [Marinicauda salina]|uniref:DUF692 domain-containing protein n=1 Tax=Marinicauda salina TaxID=2135793 RepID=A0A2U2BRW5_9PROT|nr:DUF692 domain-containing protein [Marinicauda salina]PWE16736.1 DUF692 domain-containing protein [Marinicauda salina]